MIHKVNINELKTIIKGLIKEELSMSLNEGYDYRKVLGKAIDNTNALIQQALTDGVEAVEPYSTWQSVYVFNPVILMNTVLKISYKEYNGRGWENKSDRIGLAQDKVNNFEDAKYTLSWIRKAIKKGYTENRRSEKKQAKDDFKYDNNEY